MPITGADRAPLPPRIETERLVLRPLRRSDAAALHRLLQDWEVVRYTANIPHPYEPGMAEAWMEETLADAHPEGVYAIERRAEVDLIGCVGLRRGEGARSGEFGFWIGRPYWRQGFGSEAVRAVIEAAFATGAFDRLEAAAVPENAASIRLQEKLGFTFVGVEQRPAPARGGPRRMEVRRLERRSGDRPAAAATGPTVLVVAVALIDPDGRVLLARRPEGKPMAGLWEFPGGKLHDGETPEAALIRELKEELGIDVATRCLAPFTFASHVYPSFHLLMPLYVCRVWEGTVSAREGQELAWVRPNRFRDYPMPPADKPLAAMLRDLL